MRPQIKNLHQLTFDNPELIVNLSHLDFLYYEEIIEDFYSKSKLPNVASLENLIKTIRQSS
jgi:hypothetical protein